MTTTFKADIRAKFRPEDLLCMVARGILMDDPDWMCDPAATFGFADHGNARCVFARLETGDMPPDGAWSPAWLATYAKWMSDGFKP